MVRFTEPVPLRGESWFPTPRCRRPWKGLTEAEDGHKNVGKGDESEKASERRRGSLRWRKRDYAMVVVTAVLEYRRYNVFF